MTQPPNGRLVVQRGASVTMACRANGNPSPVVSWVRLSGDSSSSVAGGSGGGGGGSVQLLPGDRRVTMAKNGMILTLSEVAREDAGRFRCTATNGVGRDAARTIALRVMCERH